MPRLTSGDGPVAVRLGAVAVGLVVDRFAGEPPNSWHPVAWFGSVMQLLEERIYRDDRRAGVVYTLAGTCLGWAVGARFGRSATGVAVLTAVATGGKSLGDAAGSIGQSLSRQDLAAARHSMPMLVGRNPSELDEAELIRATIESVAENTVDAVVAPALWAAVAGGPGVAAYRAVNTMDAMVGHRSARYANFGWCSARLDDLANWLPARLTALLVMLVRPHSASEVVRLVRRDAGLHPSPNGGVAETAFAAALGVRLGGTNTYGDRVEHRGFLGDGDAPTFDHIDRSVRLLRHVTYACGALLAVGGVAVHRVGRRRGADERSGKR